MKKIEKGKYQFNQRLAISFFVSMSKLIFGNFNDGNKFQRWE